MSATRTQPPSAGATMVFSALLEARTGQQLAANRTWRLDTALQPLLTELDLPSADALVARLLDGMIRGSATGSSTRCSIRKPPSSATQE